MRRVDSITDFKMTHYPIIEVDIGVYNLYIKYITYIHKIFIMYYTIQHA